MDKNTLLEIANKGCENLEIWVYSEPDLTIPKIYCLTVNKNQYILEHRKEVVMQENKTAISFWLLCEHLGWSKYGFD